MRDEVVAGVRASILALLLVFVRFDGKTLRLMHSPPGDFNFRMRRALGEILDGMAVIIASGKIHLGKIAAIAQYFVDQADALDEFLPIK